MAAFKEEAPPTRTRIPRAAKDNPKHRDEPIQANTSKPRAKKAKTAAAKSKPAGVTKKKAPVASKAKATRKKSAAPKEVAKEETVVEDVDHTVVEDVDHPVEDVIETVQEPTGPKKTKRPGKKAGAKK